jgi:hypothetical protein
LTQEVSNELFLIYKKTCSHMVYTKLFCCAQIILLAIMFVITGFRVSRKFTVDIGSAFGYFRRMEVEILPTFRTHLMPPCSGLNWVRRVIGHVVQLTHAGVTGTGA